MWLIALFLILVAVMVAAYKKRVSTVQNLNQGVSIFDDFVGVNSASAGDYKGLYFLSNTDGSATADIGIGSIHYPGSVNLSLFSTSDAVDLYSPMLFYLDDNSVISTETRFYMAGNLNTQAFYGFADSFGIDVSSYTNACGLLYDKTVSDFWIARVVTNGVTVNSVTTVPGALTTDTYFKVLVQPSRSLFYINNVLVATIAAAPDSSSTIKPLWRFAAPSLSPAGAHLYTDAIALYQEFLHPRTFSNTTVTQ